jgi:alanyl-tRNA synthetase
LDDLANNAKDINGIKVVSAHVASSSIPILRELGDSLRQKLKSAVIVLGTIQDDKPAFVALVTPDLVGKGLRAGEIVKQVAEVTGGSGGGKPEMAQAGGKDKNKLDQALTLVASLVEKVSK